MYLTTIHSTTPDSDGANTLLAGQAIGQGHVLLHGWALAPDSFWTIDALFYTLTIWVMGINGALLYVVPALIASLVIVVGMLLARTGYRGAAGFVGGATVVVILAAPSHAMASFFLLGSMHMGTVLWSLVAFLALSRGRFGLRWYCAVVFLAGGMLGDLMMVAYGTVPVFVAGLVEGLRQRHWRSGVPQASAAMAATVLAAVAREVARGVGSFAIRTGYTTVSWSDVSRNIMNALRFGAELVGSNSGVFGTGGVPVGLQLAHDVIFALLVASVVSGCWRLVRGALFGSPCTHSAIGADRDAPPDVRCNYRLDDLLTIACCGSPVTFVVLANGNVLSARYLTAAVVFGSVLAGRSVARWWATSDWLRVKRGISAFALALLLCMIAAVGYTLSSPAVPPSASQLAAWLAGHDLRDGIGDYWSSNITTVESGGAVAVRPVLAAPRCALQRFPFGSAAGWYAGRHFDFFVYNATWAHGSGPNGWESAERSWGHASRVYRVGTYRVLIWPHAISVSPTLTPVPNLPPGCSV